VIEFLVELVCQVVLEIIWEALRACGVFSPRGSGKAINAWWAVAGYIALGIVIGLVSLWPLPDHLIQVKRVRILNLVITPIAVGMVTCGLDAVRSKTRQGGPRFDRFACGYMFALSLSLIRLWLAK